MLRQSDQMTSAVDRDAFDLFSFDIFETVLLRPTGRADDVFDETGRRAAERGLLAPGLTPPLFAALRRRAASLAEIELSGGVPGLADIYQRMPGLVLDIDAVMRLEVETEADLIVVNPDMASFIADLAAEGRKIVAVSDMYLSAEQISFILRRAGGDPGWFRHIYVSCDYGVRKGDGGLFRRLLDDFPATPPSRVRHIGDDPMADVAASRLLGIFGVDYGVPTELGRIVDQENAVACGGRRAADGPARRLAARRCGDGAPAFWERLGALIVAPVLVRYAVFVVEECRRLGIRNVAALMREGRLLSRLMDRYARLRGYDMRIYPLYASRLALGATEAPRWDRAALTDLFERRPHIRLGDLLSRGWGTPPPDLAALADLLVEEIANRRLPSGETALEALAAWFAAPAAAEAAAAAAGAARRLTVDYLRRSFGDDEATALVDLGARATTAAQILKLEGVGDRRRLHGFLLYATEQVGEAMAAGLPLSLYAGDDQDALTIGRQLYRSPHVLERLLTGLDDCTSGYRRRDDGEVEPTFVPTAAKGAEREAIEAVEQGVWTYWRCWAQTEAGAAPVAGRSADLLPWLRLVRAPSPEEAELLGALSYDYNDGSAWVRQICDAVAVENVRPVLEGADALLSARLFGLRPPAVPWPQGAATLLRHDVLRRHYDALNADPSHAAFCSAMVDRIRRQGVDRILVYAAGGAAGMGPAFLEAAAAAGLEVAAYLDRFPHIVGAVFNGAPTIPLEALPRYRDVPIALVTLGYRAAMLEDVRRVLGGDPPLAFTLDNL